MFLCYCLLFDNSSGDSDYVCGEVNIQIPYPIEIVSESDNDFEVLWFEIDTFEEMKCTFVLSPINLEPIAYFHFHKGFS